MFAVILQQGFGKIGHRRALDPVGGCPPTPIGDKKLHLDRLTPHVTIALT
jgi:hypothetical protein